MKPEIRDLYDKNRRLTGEKLEKGQLVPLGRYYLTVVVWIQNSRGEFLLQLTSPQKGNKWSTTGGHPKAGETSLQGIITEIKEELGIDIKAKSLTLFKTLKTDDDFVDLYYAQADFLVSATILQQDEVQEVKWVSAQDIDKLIADGIFMPSHIEFYRLCLNYLQN